MSFNKTHMQEEEEAPDCVSSEAESSFNSNPCRRFPLRSRIKQLFRGIFV